MDEACDPCDDMYIYMKKPKNEVHEQESVLMMYVKYMQTFMCVCKKWLLHEQE